MSETCHCLRCGWLHINVHSGYVCPCVPCECMSPAAQTSGGEEPVEPCSACEGNGWRMKGGQSGGLVALTPGEPPFSPGVVPLGGGNQHTRSKPFREPRYDDVYAEGTAVLDAMARGEE